jgi:SAM-dependent methyltransferase
MAISFRKLKRAWAVYRDFGLREILSRSVRRLGFSDREHSEWLRIKAEKDVAFDRRLGTDTGGIQDIQEHPILGENAKYGGSHIASDPNDFETMMASLELAVSDYAFIDLGCGKGRALILAAQYPFARVIGVEFVPAFVDSARENVRAAAKRLPLLSEIEIEMADATAFNFPNGPILLYLFNPFDAHIVRQVASNAYRSWQNEKRPFTIIYMNPVHVEDLTCAGWQVTGQGPAWIQLECQK